MRRNNSLPESASRPPPGADHTCDYADPATGTISGGSRCIREAFRRRRTCGPRAPGILACSPCSGPDRLTLVVPPGERCVLFRRPIAVRHSHDLDRVLPRPMWKVSDHAGDSPGAVFRSVWKSRPCSRHHSRDRQVAPCRRRSKPSRGRYGAARRRQSSGDRH